MHWDARHACGHMRDTAGDSPHYLCDARLAPHAVRGSCTWSWTIGRRVGDSPPTVTLAVPADPIRRGRGVTLLSRVCSNDAVAPAPA